MPPCVPDRDVFLFQHLRQSPIFLRVLCFAVIGEADPSTSDAFMSPSPSPLIVTALLLTFLEDFFP